jgi:hypothetical protein
LIKYFKLEKVKEIQKLDRTLLDYQCILKNFMNKEGSNIKSGTSGEKPIIALRLGENTYKREEIIAQQALNRNLFHL